VPLAAADRRNRIWLSSLSSGSIRSWEELAYSFIQNFKGTSKRPVSIEELRACTQRTGESIRSYILRWSNIKNSAVHISEERTIDAFKDGVKRQDFKEELGQVKPKTLDHLMDIANKWADGEDSVHRAHSDEEDDYGRRRERRSKRRSRVYDDRDGPDMVAAGYADRRNENNRSSGGYRGNNFCDGGRPTQTWQRCGRDDEPSAYDKLSGPWTIHFYIDKQDDKKKASHMLKDCREFQKLSEGFAQMREQIPNPGFGHASAPGDIAHGAPPPPPVEPSNHAIASVQNNGVNGYPVPKGSLMIQKGRPTNRVQKKITRQVRLAVIAPPAIPEYLSGSESCITFSRSDHPRQIPRPGHAALVLEAQIGGFEMSRVFMDGGSDINLMFASTLAAMRILLCSLEQSDTTFHGIVLGKGIFPLGKIWLDVIFLANPTTFGVSGSSSKWWTGHHNTTPSSGAWHSQGS
jgi:hypothetical protein